MKALAERWRKGQKNCRIRQFTGKGTIDRRKWVSEWKARKRKRQLNSKCHASLSGSLSLDSVLCPRTQDRKHLVTCRTLSSLFSHLCSTLKAKLCTLFLSAPRSTVILYKVNGHTSAGQPQIVTDCTSFPSHHHHFFYSFYQWNSCDFWRILVIVVPSLKSVRLAVILYKLISYVSFLFSPLFPNCWFYRRCLLM